MVNADLHLHTTYSDGTAEVEALIQEALTYGLEAIAITDHDNTDSYTLAIEAAKAINPNHTLEIIPAIEINTVWHEEKVDIHILGFYIDGQHPALKALVNEHQASRRLQIRQILDSLRQSGVIDIPFEDIEAGTKPTTSLGRPHIAYKLLERGRVNTVGEAFQKYLNRQATTYVSKKTASPHEAVEAIYDSGGIPVIAHPGDTPKIEILVRELMDYGLRGLEAYHRSHSPGVVTYYCNLAEKLGLIVTGGTDYHGLSDSYAQALSRLYTPDRVLTELREERDRRQKAKFKVS